MAATHAPIVIALKFQRNFKFTRTINNCPKLLKMAINKVLCSYSPLVQACYRRQRSKGWDPIGAHITLLVDGNKFLQFSPILQPACLHRHPSCVERHGPQAVGCEIHISLFGQPDLSAFLLGWEKSGE